MNEFAYFLNWYVKFAYKLKCFLNTMINQGTINKRLIFSRFTGNLNI